MKSALTMLALVLLCASSNAVAQRVSNDFDMEFPNGNETSLISDVQTFFPARDYIGYSFLAGIHDGIARVKWEDKNGGTLLTGVSNQTLIIFAPTPGTIVATQWSVYLGALHSPPTQVDGIADFSGSHTSKEPCSGLRCPAPYLEPTPVFPNLGGGASSSLRAEAASTLVGETEGRLGLRVYTSPPAIDPDAFTTISLVTFASIVEQNGAEFTYRYTVTNETDFTLEFDWEAAGLSGEFEPHSSMDRAFVSALEPTSQRSLATVVLGGFDAGGGLDLLTPVPEPSQTLSILAAAAPLAYRLRRRVWRARRSEARTTSRSRIAAYTAAGFLALAASAPVHGEPVRATMTGEVTSVFSSSSPGAAFELEVGDLISVTAIYDDADRVLTGPSSEAVFVKPGTGYTMTFDVGVLTFTEVQDRNFSSPGLTPAVVYGTGVIAGQVLWNYFAEFGVNGAPATFDALSGANGEWLATGGDQGIAGTWLAGTLEITPVPEPEPATAVLATGVGLLSLMARRRRVHGGRQRHAELQRLRIGRRVDHPVRPSCAGLALWSAQTRAVNDLPLRAVRRAPRPRNVRVSRLRGVLRNPSETSARGVPAPDADPFPC